MSYVVAYSVGVRGNLQGSALVVSEDGTGRESDTAPVCVAVFREGGKREGLGSEVACGSCRCSYRSSSPPTRSEDDQERARERPPVS